MKKEVILILLSFLTNLDIGWASNAILLKSRRFTPERGISSATKANIEAIPGRAHVLVQLEQIPTIAERKEFEDKGIKLLSYIPNKAWFASICFSSSILLKNAKYDATKGDSVQSSNGAANPKC